LAHVHVFSLTIIRIGSYVVSKVIHEFFCPGLGSQIYCPFIFTIEYLLPVRFKTIVCLADDFYVLNQIYITDVDTYEHRYRMLKITGSFNTFRIGNVYIPLCYYKVSDPDQDPYWIRIFEAPGFGSGSAFLLKPLDPDPDPHFDLDPKVCLICFLFNANQH